MSQSMVGGIIAIGLAVLGLMCCDRRTIVMIAIVSVLAVLLAWTHPGKAAGAEPDHTAAVFVATDEADPADQEWTPIDDDSFDSVLRTGA